SNGKKRVDIVRVLRKQSSNILQGAGILVRPHPCPGSTKIGFVQVRIERECFIKVRRREIKSAREIRSFPTPQHEFSAQLLGQISLPQGTIASFVICYRIMIAVGSL